MTPSLHTRVRRLHLRARRAVEDWLGGAYHSAFKGVGISFEEVREYQPGDDVRAIDWNVTARAGTPFIKRFVEERELTVMLAVDLSATMAFASGARSKKEAAAEAAALIAMAALRNNDRVGLLLFGGVRKIVPPRKGARHALRLVRDLLQAADAEPARGSFGPIDALGTLGRILHRRALVVLATDFLCHGYVNALRLTAFRHDLIAACPVDPWERALPDVGLLALRDAAGAWTLDSRDAAVREEYRRRMATRLDAIRETVRRAGADWLELATDADPLDGLRRFFDRRTPRRPLA